MTNWQPPPSGYGSDTSMNPDVIDAWETISQMQSLVQQYAPQLSSQWGWLYAQGNLLQQGKPARITAQQFIDGVDALDSKVTAAHTTAADIAAAGGPIITPTGTIYPSGYAPPSPGFNWGNVAPWLVLAGLVVFVLPAVLGDRK